MLKEIKNYSYLLGSKNKKRELINEKPERFNE
jgi:hypothetical protein